MASADTNTIRVTPSASAAFQKALERAIRRVRALARPANQRILAPCLRKMCRWVSQIQAVRGGYGRWDTHVLRSPLIIRKPDVRRAVVACRFPIATDPDLPGCRTPGFTHGMVPSTKEQSRATVAVNIATRVDHESPTDVESFRSWT
jgi:hypothetical protein